METKTGVLVVLLCLGAAALTGLVLTFMKPQSTRESEAITAPSAASFPQHQSAGAADEPASKLPAPEDWNAPPKAGSVGSGESLSMVRGGGGMSATPSADQASAEAAKAAASGDARGVMAGLKEEGDGKGTGKKATRALMQRVVDIVHKTQPRWYSEFLSNKQLKGIADAYDKTSDFPSFIRQLAQSTPFKGMLKKRANTPQLRQLTTGLLTSAELGPKLQELFFANAKDPDVIDTVRQYGAGAGLPAELLSFVGAGGSRRTAAAKPRMGEARPRLKASSFGNSSFGSKGGGSKDEGGAGADGQLPAGVDPAMMEKYQKYLKK